MKKILFLSILAVIFLIGCAQESSDINPLGPNAELNKVSAEDSPFIALPIRDNSLAKIITSKEEWISPWKSEKITLEDRYWSGESYIKVKMVLEFERGTVDKFVKVFAQMDTEVAAFNFFPSPITFNKPAILNVEISGLTGSDLESFKEVKKFVFISQNGELEEMSYEKLGIEENNAWGRKTGTFILQNCQIPHFSRFGFVR